MASLSITLEEIYAALGAEMGISRDPSVWDASTLADAQRIIRAGRRKFYNNVPTDGGIGHKWSFLDLVRPILTTASQSNGTVTIVDGVVTLASATFPASAQTLNSFLVVDGAPYYIASRDSDTQVTLTNTSVDAAAGTEYELVQYRYALPSNFGGLNAPITREVGTGTQSPVLESLLEQDLRSYYAGQYRTGIPTKYAPVPVTDTDSGIASWYIDLWPIPTTVYELRVNYHVDPGDGLNLADDVAFMDPIHSETLLEAILAAAEVYVHGSPGAHSARFADCLLASISRDKRMSGARNIKTPGYPRLGYPLDLINAPLVYPTSP